LLLSLFLWLSDEGDDDDDDDDDDDGIAVGVDEVGVVKNDEPEEVDEQINQVTVEERITSTTVRIDQVLFGDDDDDDEEMEFIRPK